MATKFLSSPRTHTVNPQVVGEQSNDRKVKPYRKSQGQDSGDVDYQAA